MEARRVYIWILGCACLLAWSSSPCLARLQGADSLVESPFLHFIETDSTQVLTQRLYEGRLKDYISRLEKVKVRKHSDLQFLRSLFFKTHRSFLHKYSAGATLDETLKSGEFGCLSGTALYALILNHFGYDFEIVEMTSHVYLKVHLKNQTLLIESTLPGSGFISSEKRIVEATEQYTDESRKTNSLMAIASIGGLEEAAGTYQRSINLKQLSGLQYYNEAIFELGDQAYESAFLNARKALNLYPSLRTERLMEIVINKILQSKNLTKDQKTNILNSYITQVKEKKLTQR